LYCFTCNKDVTGLENQECKDLDHDLDFEQLYLRDFLSLHREIS